LTFGPGEFEISLAQEQVTLRQYREASNRLYLVGMLGDQIVSTLSFAAGQRPRVRHAGEFGLSVRKAYWGLGIGTRMLEALLSWARGTQTITKVNLRVRTDNLRAIALYLRKGFAIEGTICKAIRIGGTYYDHHWMGLDLEGDLPGER
jgi:RimJ/RimL family protein N-acetyltransferase